MSNYTNVCGLNRDERQLANLETYRRVLDKCDNPYECLDKDTAKEIKDVLKGVGKLVAFADGKRTMAGNNKYILFVEIKEGIKVYLYTSLNGLYNEMGPYDDLDTALSNADCYGLFEESKKNVNAALREDFDINSIYPDYPFEDDGYEEHNEEEGDCWEDWGIVDDDFGPECSANLEGDEFINTEDDVRDMGEMYGCRNGDLSFFEQASRYVNHFNEGDSDTSKIYEYIRQNHWGDAEFRNSCSSFTNIADYIFSLDLGYDDEDVYEAARWLYDDCDDIE